MKPQNNQPQEKQQGEIYFFRQFLSLCWWPQNPISFFMKGGKLLFLINHFSFLVSANCVGCSYNRKGGRVFAVNHNLRFSLFLCQSFYTRSESHAIRSGGTAFCGFDLSQCLVKWFKMKDENRFFSANLKMLECVSVTLRATVKINQ